MLFAPLVALLAAAPSVELPLDEYRQLIAPPKKEPRSFTAIESVRLSGSLEKGVTLTVTGRSFGEQPDATVITGEVVLTGCRGEALLQRSSEGAVVLTPLQPGFTVRCGLEVPDASEWSFKVPGVVDVGGALSDGVVEVTGVSNGVATVLVRRRTAQLPQEAGEAKPASLVGRYRLTITPDDTRFRWELSAHNPNRHVIRFPLVQRPGETIESLETRARYESDAKGWVIELPPGETQLSVSGVMSLARFEPPFDAAAQFVLIDAHPLLRFDLSSDGKRISPGETQMQAQFRAAQALLLARGQHVEWKATVLETLPSNRYTVKSLAASWYVGPEGVLMGQTEIGLDNQGAPELVLPMSATPEFASVGGLAVPLTTNEQHQLSLPLGMGAQQLKIDQRSALKAALGLAVGKLELPGVGASSTYSSVTLRAGRDWVPLFHGYAGRTWFALPPLGQLVLIFLFALWAVKLFASLGLGSRASLGFGGLTAVLASSTEAAHWPVLVGLAAGSMLWVATWLRESKVKLVAPSGLVGISMVLGVGMIALIGAVTLFGDNIRRMYGMSADALAGDDDLSGYDPNLSRKTMKNFGQNNAYDDSGAGAGYQGVGAARELPYGSSTIELSQELADTREPSTATVVLVSRALTNGVWMVLQLSTLALAFALRRRLVEGVKQQLERLFAARPVVAAVEPEPA